MSDIWSVGGSQDGSVGQADASEDWDCSSDSDDERPRKRAKKGGASSRRPKVGATATEAQSAPDVDPQCCQK